MVTETGHTQDGAHMCVCVAWQGASPQLHVEHTPTNMPGKEKQQFPTPATATVFSCHSWKLPTAAHHTACPISRQTSHYFRHGLMGRWC